MKAVKIILIILAVLVAIALGYGGFAYYKMTRQERVDLGIGYNREDAETAIAEKAGVEVDDLGKLYFGSDFKTQGSKAVDQVFTDAEISAIQNYANEKAGPFKEVQIHFIGGNKVEASGFVDDPRVTIPGPVYVKGDVIQTGPKSFSTSIDHLQVGDYVVPRPIIETANSEFIGYVNGILGQIEGLNIENVEIQNGQVHFVGDLPEKIIGAN
ncbi:MAG: hypothetical protein ACOYUZ_02595 [Patescibacteria group bacterium]